MSQRVVRYALMPNKNYSRNAEQELEMVKYAERHGNAADAKHYDTNESNILYWPKQKLVLAKMPAKKRRTRLSSAASLRTPLLLRLQPKMNQFLKISQVI